MGFYSYYFNMHLNTKNSLFTSESVGPGHPDKICDQISDAILDACLSQDSLSKVACEVFASNRLIVIGGEITTKAYVDVVKIAWEIVRPLGYCESDFTIISNINSQSPDISNAVSKDNTINAGDQGIVFGYACDETPDYMPLPITLAHELVYLMDLNRKKPEFHFIKSDMKSQVTIDYSKPENPRIDTFIASIQHSDAYSQGDVINFVKPLMLAIAQKYHLNSDFNIIINPSGKFVIGGPIGDTGLTGRKIIVDTYGGYSRHGGGAFSGKDPSKVDRSGSYFARYIAKNIVASGLAKKCEIQLSFGIGLPEPISININTFNTSKYSEDKILKAILLSFNFNVNSFINELNLFEPQYLSTSVFGHFGKNQRHAPWEELNYVDILKKNIGE